MANFLIISGTSDIGFSVAKKLIDQGHGVYATGRQASQVEELGKQLQISCSVLDASDFNAVSDLFASVKAEMGSIDGVVNCAGSLLLKPGHLTSQADYQAVIAANLTTAFAVVHAAGKHMASEGGSVVLISSSAAQIGIANHEAIAAAKAGIIGLAMSAAATYANFNLRFNVVAPGLTETKLTKALTQNSVGRKVSENMHALGRLGSAGDVAEAILFFLNSSNSWVTGQVLAVDGGLSRVKPKMKA